MVRLLGQLKIVKLMLIVRILVEVDVVSLNLAKHSLRMVKRILLQYEMLPVILRAVLLISILINLLQLVVVLLDKVLVGLRIIELFL